MRKRLTILSLLICMACAGRVWAQAAGVHLRVNSLLLDNVVLQRETRVPVWGTADEGQHIAVEFAGQKLETVAKDGKWKVWLEPMPANANPQTITVLGGETTLTITNVLVGDVWVASGQSNMQAMLHKGVDGWEQAVATANYPLIHQYYVPEHVANSPAADANGSWTVCSPETAQHYSAVGFFFARDIFQTQKVPVGILFPAWGGRWLNPGPVKKGWTRWAKPMPRN